MAISSRRFDQVFLSVISGLLVVGSALLVLWGPPPNSRGSAAMAIVSSGKPSSEGTETTHNFDAPADALVPANLQAGASNDSAELQSASSSEEPSSVPVTSPVRPSSHNRKSTALESPPVTIRHVPVSDAEIEKAWTHAASDKCEFISPDDSFEITRPTPFLTANDRRQAARRRPVPAIRRHVLSVGLQMPRQAEQSLPALGRRSILDYIHRHYVTIQARLQHDPVSGRVYLNHRPLAATMQFTGSRLTQEFTETVAKSMHDFRGLGIWLLPEEELIAENLRTLVLAHRYTASPTGTVESKPRSIYELMFIRARGRSRNTTRGSRASSSHSLESADDASNDLELHTFVTSNERQSLHHVTADGNLHDSQQCGIKALIEFTAFSHGAYPTESIVVGTEVRGSATYSKESLERFARQKHWTGSCFDHLSQLLDAIVNRELTSD